MNHLRSVVIFEREKDHRAGIGIIKQKQLQLPLRQ